MKKQRTITEIISLIFLISLIIFVLLMLVLIFITDLPNRLNQEGELGLLGIGLLVLIVILLLGSLGHWLCYKYIVKPIVNLSNQANKIQDKKKIEFKESKIREINDLSKCFERMSLDILQHSQKLSNAIKSFYLGIYFYKNDEEAVYCTQPFLDMCGINLQEGYIDRSDFDKVYNEIVNSPFNNKYEAYFINNNWIKLETKVESNFVLGNATEITEQVREIKKIERELDIDSLTKLYNRSAFEKMANPYIERNSNKIIAVIMWDIDKLKYFNDRYGHDIGDKYIIKFADSLKILEKYDGLVARRSGDEFYAIIAGATKEEIIKVIKKVRNSLDKSYLKVSETAIENIKASAGIAWYPEEGRDISSLLENADRRLYESKFGCVGLGELFNNQTKKSLTFNHYNLEFAKIIDGDYITFAYQPIVDAKTGSVYGYEMLMRIFSNIINSPQKLIDLAKENKQVESIEELTFTKGFEAYQMNIDNIQDKKIFLNSISNIALPKKVMAEIIKVTNNDLKMLVVELTNVLSADPEIVINKINNFKKYKALIAIDNFKLSFIKNIKAIKLTDFASINKNIDYIKIDISIIDDIETSSRQQKSLKEIIAFAKKYNLKTIAVGIKNQEELEIVIQAGVDYLQGYYLGYPTVKPAEIKRTISAKIRSINAKLSN